MKTFRFFAALTMAVFCTGFYSCSEKETESDDILIEEWYGNGDPFPIYGLNPMHYELRDSYYYGNINTFSGLKNNRLWVSAYDRTTKLKIGEWIDNKTFDRKRTIHVGYGEYKEVQIYDIKNFGSCFKNNFFVASLGFSWESIKEYKIIFKTENGEVKEIDNNEPSLVYDWYKESLFVGECCYNSLGDTLYVKSKPGPLPVGIPISYEEIVNVGTYGNYISAVNLNIRSNEYVWNTQYKLPFEVYSDTKKELVQVDKSTNIWEYKLDLLYYDGTKLNYTFFLNIENGEFFDNSNESI